MSKTLAVGMTTAQRKERYVFESISSFRSAGFPHELQVYAEPKSHDLTDLPGVVVHWNETRLNCFANWRHALTQLTSNISADWYMVVQDDVKYRDDAWHQLEKAINSPKYQNVGFLSPYTSAAMVSSKFKNRKGWHPAAHGRKKGFWGALTFCMPAKSARMLLNNKRFIDHGKNNHRKVDVIVGNCFRDMNLPRLVCLPSLCDHIGKVSTLGRHKIKGISHGRRGFRFREEA